MATRLAASRRMPMLAAASIIGALILVAHIITLRIVPQLGTELVTLLAGTPLEFSIPRNELRDLGLHVAMFSLFTLSYRLSWRGSGPAVRWATFLLCSGWGAFCESLQIFIHRRDFSPLDLSVNMLTPLLLIGIIRLFEKK
ncbi:MAG: hypothetical protein R3F46_14070 [bacterium]